MKHMLQLFLDDLSRVTRNAIAIVLLFGVVIIPSFFGWFNVLSSWDPFGNVKNLKVAVANADKGYESDLFPLTINVGDQVISNLRANSDLNWVFTSEDQAIEGTKSGEYYAALVLPENFSQEMMTFLSPGAKPAQIEYYSNEKENALSPKITDEAATDVSTQINESFTKTLTEVSLALISSLADGAGSPEVQAALDRLEVSASSASRTLTDGATTLEMFSSLISSSSALVQSAGALTTSTVDAIENATGSIAQGVSTAQSLKAVLDAAAAAISDALAGTSGSYQTLIDEVNRLDGAFAGQSQAASGLLGSLAGEVDVQVGQYQALRDAMQAQADAATDPALHDALALVVTHLNSAIDRQVALEQRIDQAATSLLDTNAGFGPALDEIVALAQDAQAAIEGARTSYDTSLKPQLDQLAASLGVVDAGFSNMATDLTSAARTLAGGTGSLVDTLTQAEALTAGLATDLRAAATQFTNLASSLGVAKDSGDLDEVHKLIGSNPSLLAGNLVEPVGLKTIAVFEVKTFGAQMAPFYTVLAMWVGSLLLSVLIRTDVSPAVAMRVGPLTKAQEYLGRFGIIAVLGFLQSSLLYLGLIGFVGVQPAHPFLLVLVGWVMSLVFALITYTLVLSFGEAGKALAVFLLVVQISAGGGAYPLQVLPQWFQNISPWLPVTHATDAVRSAIAGIYDNDYWISLLQLGLFIVPALLIGLALRLPVLKINTSLTNALESTKLM